MGYIYVLKHPQTNEIRYVGKTEVLLRRLTQHIYTARSGRYKHKLAMWIKSLLVQDLKPILDVIEEHPTDINEAEIRWIAFYREQGLDLCNLTDGGDGQSSSYVPSAETRAKTSASLKGRVKSEEERQHISEALMGHEISDETKRKISESHLGVKLPKETREKMSASKQGELNSFYGKTHSEETRAKISQARRGTKRDPEVVRAAADKRRGYNHTEESRALMSEKVRASHRRRWINKNYQTLLSAGFPPPDLVA